MIKKIILILAVIFTLSYFGYIKINTGKVKEAVKNVVKEVNTPTNRESVKNIAKDVVNHAKEIAEEE